MDCSQCLLNAPKVFEDVEFWGCLGMPNMDQNYTWNTREPGVGPWGRTGSGGYFDRGPGVLIFELHGAQVTK